MGRDSNPRWTLAHAGFQDRCLKPLGHPSDAQLILKTEYRSANRSNRRKFTAEDAEIAENQKLLLCLSASPASSAVYLPGARLILVGVRLRRGRPCQSGIGRH